MLARAVVVVNFNRTVATGREGSNYFSSTPIHVKLTIPKD